MNIKERYMNLNDLSIVTITYNNTSDLVMTLNNCRKYCDLGATQWVINGGESVKNICSEYSNVRLLEEADRGIFDALNKGIKIVSTDYFMNVHSGDKLLLKPDEILTLLSRMSIEKLDLMLGDQIIPLYGSFRMHSARYWKPWFLKVGCQPPHLPTIYRSDKVKSVQYDINNTVIGDFEYFRELFSKRLKYGYSGKIIIEMGPGGNTTSGLKSFILVSKEFIRQYGFRGVIPAFIRLPFKLIQSF